MRAFRARDRYGSKSGFRAGMWHSGVPITPPGIAASAGEPRLPGFLKQTVKRRSGATHRARNASKKASRSGLPMFCPPLVAKRCWLGTPLGRYPYLVMHRSRGLCHTLAMAHIPKTGRRSVIRRIRGHYTDKSDVVDCEADDPRAGGWFVERWALDHRARGHWKRDHKSLNTMDEASSPTVLDAAKRSVQECRLPQRQATVVLQQ